MIDGPHRDGIHEVLPDDLREELQKAEDRCEADLVEAEQAKGRAEELIRTGHFDRPQDVLLAELEQEYRERLAYHRQKMAKQVRWVLESWKDTPDQE